MTIGGVRNLRIRSLSSNSLPENIDLIGANIFDSPIYHPQQFHRNTIFQCCNLQSSSLILIVLVSPAHHSVILLVIFGVFHFNQNMPDCSSFMIMLVDFPSSGNSKNRHTMPIGDFKFEVVFELNLIGTPVGFIYTVWSKYKSLVFGKPSVAQPLVQFQQTKSLICE